MQDVINRTALDNARRYRDDFAGADPFRHVLMEDFLEPGFLARILEEFPEPDPETMRSEFGRKSRKHAVHDITGLGPAFRHWDATLRSPAFISWLEDVTGPTEVTFGHVVESIEAEYEFVTTERMDPLHEDHLAVVARPR